MGWKGKTEEMCVTVVGPVGAWGGRSGCEHGDSSESCPETVADPGGPATQAVSGPLLQGG